MNRDDTFVIDVLGWFPLTDGRWLRLSRENHGRLDRVHLRICAPCPDGGSSPLWLSPSGPVQSTPIGISLEQRTWRALMASLKAASAKAIVDDAGVPIVTRHVQQHHAEGFSLREIAEIVGLSKSQVHRLLVEKRIVQQGSQSQMPLRSKGLSRASDRWDAP